MAVSHQSSAISKEGVLAPKPVACNNTQKHPADSHCEATRAFSVDSQKYAGGFEELT